VACIYGFFYLFRVKRNSGKVFNQIVSSANLLRKKNPEGDYFETVRIAGGKIHSRRIWRLSDHTFLTYPGIKEAFVIEKTNLETQSVQLQYFMTSYPPSFWSSTEIIDRILLHWDIETGIFGTKDNIFHEDKVRYKSLEGAKAHVTLLNSVCNTLWAPVFDSYWKNEPVSARIQFFKDYPKFNPLKKMHSSD